jgi:hypothetical protein
MTCQEPSQAQSREYALRCFKHNLARSLYRLMEVSATA